MIGAILDIPGLTVASAPPPPLPPAPALQRWLFESPILPSLALAALAVGLFVVLNRQGRGRGALIAGGGTLVLALAVAAAGALVDTPRERLMRLSRDLVGHIAAGRVDQARAMLDDDLVVAVGGGALPGGMFARGALERLGNEVRITEHVVSDISASAGDAPTTGATQFLVRATSDAGFASVWVRLNWRKSGDVWRVYLLEVLRVNGREPDGAAGLGPLGR